MERAQALIEVARSERIGMESIAAIHNEVRDIEVSQEGILRSLGGGIKDAITAKNVREALSVSSQDPKKFKKAVDDILDEYELYIKKYEVRAKEKDGELFIDLENWRYQAGDEFFTVLIDDVSFKKLEDILDSGDSSLKQSMKGVGLGKDAVGKVIFDINDANDLRKAIKVVRKRAAEIVEKFDKTDTKFIDGRNVVFNIASGGVASLGRFIRQQLRAQD